MAKAVTEDSSPAAAPAQDMPVPELPSFELVRELAQSRYSCLVVSPRRTHLALPPRYLQRKRTGIRAQLDTELRRYSESFEGVPVAYDNIKIVNELGAIYDDQSAINLDIEADFVIFKPKPGKKLVGIINKVAPSHIGCLVHGCFNASIPKPDHVSAEQWKELEFQIGNRLEFVVVCFDSDAAGVFCIRGRLRSDSSGDEMPKKNTRKVKKHCDSENSRGETANEAATAEIEDSDATVIEDAGNTAAENTEVQISNAAINELYDKKPKKKKHKDRQDLLLQASDSSGYHSDRNESKRKKSKHCD
uniref:DNA-directed RNA polymerase subunit n=1 Tax=Sphenodon punctatus TaxID=8508 RepID=A0A8D0GRL7_SPHPU